MLWLGFVVLVLIISAGISKLTNSDKDPVEENFGCVYFGILGLLVVLYIIFVA